jgi:hypothetical protein
MVDYVISLFFAPCHAIASLFMARYEDDEEKLLKWF